MYQSSERCSILPRDSASIIDQRTPYVKYFLDKHITLVRTANAFLLCEKILLLVAVIIILGCFFVQITFAHSFYRLPLIVGFALSIVAALSEWTINKFTRVRCSIWQFATTTLNIGLYVAALFYWCTSDFWQFEVQPPT